MEGAVFHSLRTTPPSNNEIGSRERVDLLIFSRLSADSIESIMRHLLFGSLNGPLFSPTCGKAAGNGSLFFLNCF